MFNSKQKSLIPQREASVATATTTSPFVKAGLKKAAVTQSGNGALKYTTTGHEFVDQFAKTGLYKQPRSYADISSDMSKLWALSPLMTVAFTLFLRMITRVVSFFDGNKTASVQRGSGLKHEGIVRAVWIAVNHPETFWKNIELFISVGSWKDVFQMLSYDLQYNGWEGKQLHWDKFGKVILAGLENPKTTNLVKKYLPQIKTNSKCKTLEAQADNVIAKWICANIFGPKESSHNYKQYRMLKVSGTAHTWQQLISKKKLLEIDFNTVHGRALAQLVSGKFLANNKLEEAYTKWIESKPIAKFTGYVTELFAKLPSKKYQIDTLNSQFAGLVETAKKNAKTSTSLIVVRDTSSSMGSPAPGTKQSCYDIGKALALFFSYMLPDGRFSNAWIEFNTSAKMQMWQGSTPFERWTNDHSGYVGSTNFQSVIELLCSIKKQGVAENEFPTGILCISDSEFNPVSLEKTNVQQAYATLRKGGFSETYIANFKIILWNLQNSYYGKGSGEKFETYGETKNVYYFSGYEPSILAFLTGVEGKETTPQTDVELLHAALDQEVMSRIEI